LLLATRTYNACRGGATFLTQYAAGNETINGVFVAYPADSVRIWQVC